MELSARGDGEFTTPMAWNQIADGRLQCGDGVLPLYVTV